MTILYRLFLAAYVAGIRFSSLFGNKKATLWLQGRYGLAEKLKNLPGGETRIWFHCASLGEFEQGRPVLEAYRRKDPQSKIVLTFFSPSGYEVRKNYAGADYIFYLPVDSRYHAKLFLDCVKPSAVFFVKYDYWHFYLKELKERKIPVYVISAVFRPAQVFFKWYGAFFRNMLGCVTRFFVQDEASGRLLLDIGHSNFTVSGDTRFDRVKQVVSEASELPLLTRFAEDSTVLVAGSTWPDDEKLMAALLSSFPRLKIILAPHEANAGRIQDLTRRFPGSVCYSMASAESLRKSRVLIIDSVGMLASVYRYGKFAFIGGGFGKGIHNILEAAVYGQPVFFGPRYGRFLEANELIERQGAASVTSEAEMKRVLQAFIRDPKKYALAAAASAQYVKEKTGATEIILAAV